MCHDEIIMFYYYWLSTVVNLSLGRTPGPTHLGHLIQFRLTTSLSTYLIPTGYEAKLRPSETILKLYEQKRAMGAVAQLWSRLISYYKFLCTRINDSGNFLILVLS